MNNRRYAIPRKENELIGSPPSPVTVSQLTPEELEEIRRKYPATKRDKAFKKPVEIKTRPKGDNDMAKFSLTEEQFKAERAAGKSVAKIAKEQGVSEATIYNHVSKWADARKPGQQKLLREKNVSPAADPKAELLDKAEKEIERLTTENQKLEEEKNEYKRMYEQSYERNTTANAKISEHLQTIEKLKESLANGNLISDGFKISIKLLEEELCRLVAVNDQMSERIEELEEEAHAQRQTNTSVPAAISETNVLESAIQDLTRARWILNRLSASGE